MFQYLRKPTGKRLKWVRATRSTLVWPLIYSFVVLGNAFYLFGNRDLKLLFSVGLVNYLYKFLVAIGATSVLYLAHAVIDGYLGELQPRVMQPA